MKGDRLRTMLVDQLDLKGYERVLDFGCGTGTLAVMIKQKYPGCIVTGIDVDPQVLEIASKKAQSAGISFLEYDGMKLQFAEGSFDRVVSSFVLHHLSSPEKVAALKELYRVLRKGGELHVLDFGVPKDSFTKIVGAFLKYLEPVEDNLLGKIPEYLSKAGFEQVKVSHSENTLLGVVTFYSSKKASKTDSRFV